MADNEFIKPPLTKGVRGFDCHCEEPTGDEAISRTIITDKR